MPEKYKALIIDDEPAARRLLRSMLAVHEDLVNVAGEAANGAEAVQLIHLYQPDLIFLDIQMPDLNGFEVLEKLITTPYIIFTTAYEEYALKAFETFSIDYLLKPIREERLEQAMEKLRRFHPGSRDVDQEQLKQLIRGLSAPKTPSAFPIRQGEKIILLRYDQISHFEANDKYVNVFTLDGKRYLTDQTLMALAQKLPAEFLRVQKSFIINKEKIRELHKHFNGRFVLVMNDQKQTRITTGLTYYDTIRSGLGL